MPQARSAWKLDSACPVDELKPDQRREPGAREQVGALDEAIGEEQQPRDQRPDTLGRVDDPGDHLQVQGEDDPGEQRPAEAQAQRPGQQVGPERRHPQLEHADPAQRRPERQEVSGNAEGREDGGLVVGLEWPPAHDVGIPERDVRERILRGVEEQLQVPRGVRQVRVARAGEPGRLGADPGRVEPERVGVGERLPGQKGRPQEDQHHDGVDQRRRQRRPALQPAQPRNATHPSVGDAHGQVVLGSAGRRRRRTPTTIASANPASATRLTIQPIRQLNG